MLHQAKFNRGCGVGFVVVVLGYGLISLACSLVGRTNLEDQFFICNADVCIIIMQKYCLLKVNTLSVIVFFCNFSLFWKRKGC